MKRPRGHVHACLECGRPFYLCCERDCDLAPTVCQACEMDRQDAYFSSLAQVDAPAPKEPHADHR